jgi:hypothetical protein
MGFPDPDQITLNNATLADALRVIHFTVNRRVKQPQPVEAVRRIGGDQELVKPSGGALDVA